MNKTIKGFVAGFITAVLTTSIVFASSVEKNISIAYENIKIYINGALIQPVDENGKPVEPFTSNGTTYLPVRALANAFGKSVKFDNDTKSIYIKDNIVSKPAAVNPTSSPAPTPTAKPVVSPTPTPTVKPATSNSATAPEIKGMTIFPSDNFWNTPVDKLPLNSRSNAYIATIGAGRRMHPDFGTVWEGSPIGIPFNIVEANQPKVKVSFDYADESDAGPYPIPASPLIEGGSDRHLLILQKGSNILYELYAAEKNSNGSWSAGSGAIWHLDRNEARPKSWTSADASGLAIFPGLVRYDEVYEKGEINHAIRITINRIQKSYIPPASHTGGTYKDANYPPMGLRLRLKANYDISGFDKHVQVILKAFKKYGVVIADVGSDMYISGAPDSRWDDEILSTINKVTANDFEAVYMGETVAY